MAVQIEIVLIAGMVAVGLIAVARAIFREFALHRRQPYDAGEPTGTPMSPQSQSLPPG
jgi:hypothetical protein